MAQFDLYRVGGGLVLDVQSNILPNVGTRLVVPLFPVEAVPQPVKRLHPIFEIAGERYLLATHLMGSVPNAQLGPMLGSLDSRYDTIRAAIDMIFLGF